MTLSETFCLERAEAAATLAAGTKLDNVRAQHLAAENTWRKMAAQAQRLTAERAARDALKAAEQAAQPIAAVLAYG